MWTIRAWLLASTGRHAEALSDVDRADAYFCDRDSATDPPWLVYYDLAEHQGSIGKVLIPIAHAEKCVELAVPRLESAIQLHRDNYPRSRTFSRTRLAMLMMDVGDPREAVSIGRQAVYEAAPLRSDRITKELDNLARVSRRHVQIGDVGDLRNDIVKLTRLEA